jgi:hypothetical protein
MRKSRKVDLQRGESFGFLGFEFRRVRSRRGRWMPLLPKGKKRTALLSKLREIFRASRSQPVGGVIEKINPILRGWVKYFAISHSSRCSSYICYWVETKDSAPSGPGVPTFRFRLEAVEQGMAVRHVGTLLGVPCFVSGPQTRQSLGLIGRITRSIGSVQERVVREIRTLRAMWRGLESGSRFG